MSRISYEQAFSDHAYLWSTYGEASDMTGGYVDQADLALLLRKPTKATARDCLISQINYWFEMGPDTSGTENNPDPSDSLLVEIAERYGREKP